MRPRQANCALSSEHDRASVPATWFWARDRRTLSRQSIFCRDRNCWIPCCDMDLRLQEQLCHDRECRVTIGFPGKLGGLGRDRDSSTAIEKMLA